MQTTLKRAIWLAHAYALTLAGKKPGHCTICGHDVPTFLPYRKGLATLSQLLRDLDIIGSDLERFKCPRCGATDRDRHLLAYIQASGHIMLGGSNVLHFAPEACLRSWILEQNPAEYHQADLFPSSPEIQCIDITKMPFDDCTFDLLIANHVLEHVDDDLSALREVERVLKPGGFAILQTPYSARLEQTLKIKSPLSEASRLLIYGQEDHVRLYGIDVFERISSVGLISLSRTHEELLPSIDPWIHGMNHREPFMCFQKPPYSSPAIFHH